jgi:hypothetical protein
MTTIVRQGILNPQGKVAEKKGVGFSPTRFLLAINHI